MESLVHRVKERTTRVAHTWWERLAQERGAAEGTGLLVSFLVLAILASVLIPVAIVTIINTDTTGWGASEILIWDLLPIIVVVGLLFMFLKKAGLGGSKGD